MATIPRELLMTESQTVQVLARRSVNNNSLFYVLEDSVITHHVIWSSDLTEKLVCHMTGIY